MTRRNLLIGLAVAVPLLALLGFGLWRLASWQGPRVTQEEVRQAVTARIQRDAPQAFLVTGRLDVVATTTVENTKTVLPDLLDLSLGTTRSTVRAPGRVSYGFDVRELRPEMIRLVGDTLVEIDVPALRVYAVEPILSEMEVRTDVGWARSAAGSGRDVERRAIVILERALRQQAQAYLQESMQPRVNSANALHQMLTPVLRAQGMVEPRFRFSLTPEMELQGTGRD